MKNILRSDAVAQAKLYRVILSGFTAGTKLTAKINNKRITYEAASAEDAASGMATLINASSYAEFQECIASSVEHELFVMARTAGQDFFVDFESQGSTAAIIQVTRTTAGHETVNEVQKIKLSDGTTGGTWTYTNNFGTGDELTGNINWGASGADVKSAIVALATPTTADLDVVKISDTEWDLYWKGAFAAVEVAEGTIDGTNLTGAGSAVLTQTKIGRGLSDEIQMFQISATDPGFQYQLVGGPLGGGVVFDNTDTAATMQTKIETKVGAGNVQVLGGNTVGAGTPTPTQIFFVRYQGAYGGLNLALSIVNSDHEFGCSVTTQTIVNGGQATANEFQVINLGQATNGTFTLGDGTSTTSPLDFETNGANLELAVEGLSYDDVEIYGSRGVFGVEFKGADANTDVPDLILGAGDLVGATSPVGTEMRKGEASVNEEWELVINGTGGTFELGDGTDTSPLLAWNIAAATLETEIETDLGEYPGVTVSGTGTPIDPFVIEVTNPAATDVNLLTADGANLTGGAGTVTETVAHHAGANEVQTITIDPGVTGGTWPATILGIPTGPYWHDEPAAVIQAAFEAAIGAGNVTVTGSAGGPYTVTFLNDYANTPVALIEVDGTNLIAGAGSELISVLLDQRSLGPNHANDGLNWTLLRVPETGDDLILEDGSVPLLHGLNWIRTFTVDIANERLTIVDHDFVDEQKITVRNSELVPDPPAGLTHGNDYYVIYLDKDHIMLSATRGGSPIDITDAGTGTHTIAVELNSFIDNSRYNGLVGLPKRNTTGSVEYYEYRNRKFRFGLMPTGDKKIVIGSGDGDGSGRMVIDNGTYEIDMQVFRTGSPVEDGVPALQHTGQNENSLVMVNDGDCGFAFYSGETAQYRKIIHTDGLVNFGEGSVAADYVRSGGETLADDCQFSGRIKLLG